MENLVVYKFLEKKYADRLVESGCIRLGTFESFRNTETSDLARMDRMDGKAQSTSIINATFDGSSSLPPELASVVTIGKGVRDIVFSNVRRTNTRISESAYIFCTSYTKNPALLKEFDCDACVEILDYRKALSAIATELILRKVVHPDALCGCFLCQYVENSTIPFTSKQHPCLIKNSRFSIQSEMRFFFPCIPRTDSLILEVPGLSSLCRIVSL